MLGRIGAAGRGGILLTLVLRENSIPFQQTGIGGAYMASDVPRWLTMSRAGAPTYKIPFQKMSDSARKSMLSSKSP